MHIVKVIPCTGIVWNDTVFGSFVRVQQKPARVHPNLRSFAEYRKQLFSRFTRATADRETVAHKFRARLPRSRNGNEVFVWRPPLTRFVLGYALFFSSLAPC